MSDAKGTGNIYGSNPVQTAAGHTSTFCAVGSATEDARLDARHQIRGKVCGHFGEKAVGGVGGGRVLAGDERKLGRPHLLSGISDILEQKEATREPLPGGLPESIFPRSL